MTAERRPTENPASARPLCILVVEDDVITRLSVAAYLRECRYQVIEAKTADEAKSVLMTGTPIDIVFSDIQMPGNLDGFGLAQWLHRMHPEIKVLLTSGLRHAMAAEDDAPALLPKPYNNNELAGCLKVLIEKR